MADADQNEDPDPTPDPTPPPSDPPMEPDDDWEPITFRTRKQFFDRMARANRSHEKKMGLDGGESVESIKKERDGLRAGMEARKRAEMTEMDRLKAERADAVKEAETATAANAESTRQLRLHRECLAMGIGNTDYALYKCIGVKDPGEIKRILADAVEEEPDAMGFSAPGERKKQPKKSTTSPGRTPTPAAGQPVKPFDARTATKKEQLAREAELVQKYG